jgi:hypothetical protein
MIKVQLSLPLKIDADAPYTIAPLLDYFINVMSRPKRLAASCSPSPGSAMKYLFPNSSRCLVLALVAISLTGCVGPIALKQALPDYDEAISQLQSQSLLLNIARARHGMPPHFTATTAIAATFNYEIDASVVGNFSGGSGGSFPTATLRLGTIVAENPTIELIPMQGEQFAKQLLTPLDDDKFRLLVNEGVPFDMIMRLTGRAFRFQTREGAFVRSVRNSPDIPAEYKEFRRIAFHLSSLNAKNLLYIHRLSFVERQQVVLSAPPSPRDLLTASEAGYEYKTLDGKNEFEISRRVIGSIVVTNYDPTTRSDFERAELNTLIASTPSNYVQIDIRPEYPSAGYPLLGAIQLRSFNEIISFIARGIEEVPEYEVDADPRTASLPGTAPKSGVWQRNTSHTLMVIESNTPPGAGIIQVRYRGSYYTVRQDPWDQAAFVSLYLLLQMSDHAVPQRAFPITISK